MEEKLKNALIEIQDLKLRNKRLEEQVRAAAAGDDFGRYDTEQECQEGERCVVLCDSIVRNVGTTKYDSTVLSGNQNGAASQSDGKWI